MYRSPRGLAAKAGSAVVGFGQGPQGLRWKDQVNQLANSPTERPIHQISVFVYRLIFSRQVFTE